MKKILSLSIVALLVLCGSVWALDVPTPTGHVNDLADVLSPKEEAQLEKKLVEWKESTSNEFAILIIPSLEGEVPEEYSLKVAETWGVGDKQKDNGIFMLIAIGDRKFRLEIGEGLEGVLPDGKAGLLINDVLPPFFRQKKFYQGIDEVSTKVIAIVGGEYTVDEATKKVNLPPVWLIFSIVGGIFGVIFILLIGGSWLDRKNRITASSYSSGRSRPRVISGSKYIPPVYVPSKSRSSSSSYKSSSSSSSGSSWGGGGFGGGGFSGGGASGGW